MHPKTNVGGLEWLKFCQGEKACLFYFLCWNGCHLVGRFLFKPSPSFSPLAPTAIPRGSRLLKVQSESCAFMTWFIPSFHPSLVPILVPLLFSYARSVNLLQSLSTASGKWWSPTNGV